MAPHDHSYLQMDEIPAEELQTILEKRSLLPSSFCAKMIEVMRELQRRRSSSRVFQDCFMLSSANMSSPDTCPCRTLHTPLALLIPVISTPLPLPPRLQGKDGFITPRDLFRWADRKPATYQELAEAGYMLLGERLRQAAECDVVKEVLHKLLPRVQVESVGMYKSILQQTQPVGVEGASAVWINRCLIIPCVNTRTEAGVAG